MLLTFLSTLFFHSISLLFWWIRFSSSFSVKLANPASARFFEGPVLSFLPFSQRCIMSSENNHYPPFPQTACSCVFKQNNNLLTHLLILSANIPLGCSKPPLNFHPSHPERAFESFFFSPFACKPSGDSNTFSHQFIMCPAEPDGPWRHHERTLVRDDGSELIVWPTWQRDESMSLPLGSCLVPNQTQRFEET